MINKRSLYDRYHMENTEIDDLLRYYFVKQDLAAVKRVINNVGMHSRDEYYTSALKNLFFTDHRCIDIFGISGIIVNMMKNVVFSGNVNIKVEDELGQAIIKKLYYDGDFLDVLRKAYMSAITVNSGKSYLVINLNSIYDVTSGIKERDLFVDFSVLNDFDVKESKRVILNKDGSIREEHEFVWTFFRNVDLVDGYKTYRFDYVYTVIDGVRTHLKIKGFNVDDDVKLTDSEIKEVLGIKTTEEDYDLVVIFDLNFGEGVLPNIITIEHNLAECLYFQQLDLSSSQTSTYTPESVLGIRADTDVGVTYQAEYKDRYEKQKIITALIGEESQKIVPGVSAIREIERHIALNVMRACMDAKISPATISYTLLERGGSTDIGIEKERSTIRLRNDHIMELELVIGKVISQLLKLFNVDVPYDEVKVIFDAYITPSVETLTNVLAKQVQFGLNSREEAIKELNNYKLTEEELEKILDDIKWFSTQTDFNVLQSQEKQLKVDNVLKSSGIEE